MTAPAGARAFEVDQFTRRDVSPVEDALGLVDARMNAAIDAAIVVENRRLSRQDVRCIPGDSVSDARITGALADELVGRNPVKTRFEAWLTSLPEGRILITTPGVDSIYNSPRYQLVVIGNMLAPELELGGVRIGTDKIGHFLQLGHRLHRARLDRGGAPLPCRELARITSEQGYYGCESGGFVYSYADMSANIAGESYWDQIFLGNGSGDPPYVSCVRGRFERNPRRAPFSFSEYVSPLWDEAVNCSMDCGGGGSYRNPDGLTIQQVTGRFACPYPGAHDRFGVTEVDGPGFCRDLSDGLSLGSALFESAYLWNSGCVNEVVSPACLASSAPKGRSP